jgi:outer membrane protein TolC
VRAAQSKSEALHEAYKSGGAAKAEVDEQRARYQEAELQLQRAQTILDLYATIADAASESAVPGEPASNNLPPAP